MQVIGTLEEYTLNFNENSSKIVLNIHSNDVNTLEKLRGLKLNVELKQFRQHRSLNSNNYAWELITKIADVLRSSKEEVYLQMLKRYGKSQMISVLSEIDVNKFLKYFEEAGESTLNGKLFKHYKVYTGSSEMDSKEMSILIDGIVSEAKELGIETMPPNELKSLKESWKL